MASMAQLNVRMEPSLKAAGDAVLDRMGVTPTQIVRALWMKLSRGVEAFDQIVEVFAKDPAAAGASVREEVAEPTYSQLVEARFKAFYEETGLDPSTYVPPTEEEWEEFEWEDWQEREHERLIYYVE